MTAEDQAELNELIEDRKKIEFFLRSEGWAEFDKAFEASEKQSYNLAVNTSNPTDMAKHLGAYHAIRNARSWPSEQLKVIKYRIQQLTGQGE